MITIALVLVVLVLLTANALLYLVPKEKELIIPREENSKNGTLSSVVLFGNNHNAGELTRIRRELTLINHKIEKNSSRIDFAFKKINKLEGALTKNGHTLIPKDELYEKIEKLEDFRREALIAIEAMKQHLKEPEKKKQEYDKELEEKIRNLVFRGRQN
jgi:chromosome segregation ATPase